MSNNKPLRNFARQGNYYARSIGTTVEIFDVSDGDYASKYAGHCCYTHTHDFAPAIEGVCNCSVSPDGKIVAAVSNKLTYSPLHLRSIETGEVILEATVGMSSNRLLCCAFNPHLKMIAAGVRGKYDPVSGQQVSEIAVFLCPPGQTAWNLAFRDPRTHRGELVVSLNFSPSDGRRLLSIDRLQCAVFDVQLKADAVLVPLRTVTIPGTRLDRPINGGIFLRDSSAFVAFHGAQLELIDADRGNIMHRCWPSDEEMTKGKEIRAAAYCHVARMAYDILVTAVTRGIDVYRVPRDLSSMHKIGFVALDCTSASLQFAPCLPLRVAAANSSGGVSIVTLPLACGEIAAALGMQREADEMLQQRGPNSVPAVEPLASANNYLRGDTTSISWTPDGTGFVIARPAANALSIFDCVVAKKTVAKHEFGSVVEQMRFLYGLVDEVDEHGNKKPPQLQVAMRSGQTVKADAVQPELVAANARATISIKTAASLSPAAAAEISAREQARAELEAVEQWKEAQERLRAQKEAEEAQEMERRLAAQLETQERRTRDEDARRAAALQKAKAEAKQRKQEQKQQLEAQRLEQERQAVERAEAERNAKIEKERLEWEAFLKNQKAEQQKEKEPQQQQQQDVPLPRGGASSTATKSSTVAAAAAAAVAQAPDEEVVGDVDDWLAANEQEIPKEATDAEEEDPCEAAWAEVQQQEQEQEQEAVEQQEAEDEEQAAWYYEEGWEEAEEQGNQEEECYDEGEDGIDPESGARRTRRRFLISAQQAADGEVHEAQAAVAEETVDED